MDPEIIKEAMRQVLSEMGGAARGGLAKKFMGGGAANLADDGTTDDGADAPLPPNAMSGLAGDAAAEALDGADEGSPEEEAAEPSAEELEEMMKSSK